MVTERAGYRHRLGTIDNEVNTNEQRSEALRELWPFVYRFVLLAGEQLGLTAEGTKVSSLDEATLRALVALRDAAPIDSAPLPGGKQPANHVGVATNVDQVERQRLRASFYRYESCQGELTPQQWKAVYLRFEIGLTQVQIGNVMGIGRSAVSNLLKRAREERDAHEMAVKESAYRVARKYLNE